MFQNFSKRENSELKRIQRGKWREVILRIDYFYKTKNKTGNILEGKKDFVCCWGGRQSGKVVISEEKRK